MWSDPSGKNFMRIDSEFHLFQPGLKESRQLTNDIFPERALSAFDSSISIASCLSGWPTDGAHVGSCLTAYQPSGIRCLFENWVLSGNASGPAPVEFSIKPLCQSG